MNANYSNGLAKRLVFFCCCKLEEKGSILLLENIMNLHIYETGCATSKYYIINLKFAAI